MTRIRVAELVRTVEVAVDDALTFRIEVFKARARTILDPHLARRLVSNPPFGRTRRDADETLLVEDALFSERIEARALL